jgi:hypothetical protein
MMFAIEATPNPVPCSNELAAMLVKLQRLGLDEQTLIGLLGGAHGKGDGPGIPVWVRTYGATAANPGGGNNTLYTSGSVWTGLVRFELSLCAVNDIPPASNSYGAGFFGLENGADVMLCAQPGNPAADINDGAGGSVLAAFAVADSLTTAISEHSTKHWTVTVGPIDFIVGTRIVWCGRSTNTHLGVITLSGYTCETEAADGINVVGISEQTGPLWTTGIGGNGPVIHYGCSGWTAATARSHNRDQHALNGNTDATVNTTPQATTRVRKVYATKADYLTKRAPRVLQPIRQINTANMLVIPSTIVDPTKNVVIDTVPGNVYDPVNERIKSNPYSALDPELFEKELMNCVHELPRASREWMWNLIDPDHEYDAVGFVYSEENEIVDRRALLDNQPKKAAGANGRPLATMNDHRRPPHPGRGEKELREQLMNVAKRIANKIHSWSELLDWMCGGERPPDGLCECVWNQLVHKELPLPDESGADAWIVRGIVRRRPRRDILLGLGSWSPRLVTLSESEKFKEWLNERFPKGDDTGTEPRDDQPRPKVALVGSFNPYGNGQIEHGWEIVLQSSHNHDMHALNGNTAWEFPNVMKEIEAMPSLNPLMEASGTQSAPEMDPVDQVAKITGLRGPQGITMSSVPRETALRGATISTANAITLLCDLNHPETTLYPITVRNGAAAALINSTLRPPLFGVGTVRRNSLTPAVESVEGMALREIISRSGNIRPDQITSNGFKTSDVAGLLRLQPERNGDSMSTVYLKLWLYSLSRAWIQDVALLPLGGEPGKFDAYTQLDVNPAVTVGFDDGTVFGCDCGGAVAPVFPYIGADIPTVAFHVSKATIPVNEPWYPIRPSLLLQNDLGFDSANIAMMALGLLPYPCGIHSILVDTLDDAGANADAQEYIPHSDLVHMPGCRTLNFLLPTNDAAAPPRTQIEANAQVLVQPLAGPTAAGALLAGQVLNVCFIGAGGLVQYSAAEYAASWMLLPGSPIDVTSLTRLMKQLAEIFGRSSDLRFCYEMACGLTCRYPAMFESVAGVATKPTVNTAAAAAQQNFFALTPHVMVVDYPEEECVYDWYLPSLNYLWFAKVMTGVFVSTPDSGPQPPMNYSFEGSPRLLQYAIHTVRDYAVTAEGVFAYYNQARQIWNDCFTQQSYTGILQQVRSVFTDSQRGSSGEVIVSDNGWAIGVLHCRLNGCRPAKDMFGFTMWDYINVPRVGFQGVWTAAGVLQMPIPSVLPDIWVQTNLAQACIAFTPMLSSNKLLTGIHVEKAEVIPVGGGGYTVPVTLENQGREVGLDVVPVFDDRAKFNARLVWHTFTADLYTHDGNVYAVSTVTSPNVVTQKSVVADWTVPNLLLPGVLTAKTSWMPFMTPAGLIVSVGVSAANGAALMTQIMGQKNITGVATWLIRGASAYPNVIISPGGRNTISKIPSRPGLGNSSASSVPASEAGEVTQS